MNLKFLFSILALFGFTELVLAKNAQEWKSRILYQVNNYSYKM